LIASVLAAAGCEVHTDTSPELARQITLLSSQLVESQRQISSLQTTNVALTAVCLMAAVLMAVLIALTLVLLGERLRQPPTIRVLRSPTHDGTNYEVIESRPLARPRQALPARQVRKLISDSGRRR